MSLVATASLTGVISLRLTLKKTIWPGFTPDPCLFIFLGLVRPAEVMSSRRNR